jgi:hypothetical protein
MGMYIGPQEWWFKKKDRSLRFNSADSAYLTRTPSTAGNQKTWTWAAWVKKSKLGSSEYIFTVSTGVNNDSGYTSIVLLSTGNIRFKGWSAIYGQTDAVYRDTSAWYHVVVALDSTQATSSDRIKIYVNGVEQSLSTSNVTLNQDYIINTNSPHWLGSDRGTGGYVNCYLADVHLVDGQQLDPTSFGEFDSDDVWQSKTYTGTYGQNGFYLNFNDNTSTSTLGKDVSGNGNDWTANNFSITEGADNDSVVDSPFSYGVDTGAGGEVVGNYCTLNPLFKTGAGTPAYSNGNLDLSAGGSGDSYFAGTFLFSTGKYYYEATINAVGNGVLIGVCRESDSTSLTNSGSYRENGAIYNLDNTTQTSGSSYTASDVIGVAIDCDNGEVQFYKNGVGQGATPSFTFTAGTNLIVRGRSNSTGASLSFNFGQRPFTYSAPSGFKALCTTNLPDSTITKGSDYMDVALYTGNGSTQTISGLGFSPDLIWVKSRSAAYSTTVYDTVRGAYKSLATAVTNAEGTNTSGLSAFNSNGFSLDGENNVLGSTNVNAVTYAAWNWDAGSSTVSNTDGSITSSVRANTTAGFSIVTYTGNSTNSTVGHGLESAPELVILKNRDNSTNWAVWHKAFGTAGSTDYLYLNSTIAKGGDGSGSFWNSTVPTSTVFSLGSGATTNNNTDDYVAYCFAPVYGYSSAFSYTGNGSNDGPMVYLGFSPRYLLFKCSSAAAQWRVFDTARSPYNLSDKVLEPDNSSAEASTSAGIDILSNGFKIRGTAGSNVINGSGQTYIGMAFAENPFKKSRAR